MARPAKLPPTTPVGIALSLEVVEAIDRVSRERGLNKRTLYEIALRRELGLPRYPGLPDDSQTELKMPA